MGTPSHGPWCGGRARPWSCRYCKRKIFWFTCDHGSVRPFDELGPPWPVHDCKERRLTQGVSLSDRGRFGPLKRKPNGARDKRVESGTGATPRNRTSRKPRSERPFQKVRGGSRKEPIRSAQPLRAERPGEERTLKGLIAEVHPRRNVHRAFGVPNTTMGLAVLGPLGHGHMGRVTLRHLRASNGEGPNAGTVTAWAPSRLLSGLSRKRAVRIRIRSQQAGKRVVWVLESVSRVAVKRDGRA